MSRSSTSTHVALSAAPAGRNLHGRLIQAMPQGNFDAAFTWSLRAPGSRRTAFAA